MKRTAFIFITFFAAGIFASCKKISVTNNTGAEWIKVISDSNVRLVGKIRADAQNNLYCSYNYKDSVISDYSAIVKLDAKGNILWRKEFTDLSIYDFVVTPENDVVIPSYSDGMITLIKLSSDSGTRSSGTPYALPSAAASFKIVGMKIFITADHNYNISGTLKKGSKKRIGFMMKMSFADAGIWGKTFTFQSSADSTTTLTGCAEISSEFYLFGNTQMDSPKTSYFFIMKTEAVGDSMWTRTYSTSSYNPGDSSYWGYYCWTSDLIPSGDGYLFGCAYNVEYNVVNQTGISVSTYDDKSARIFKFSLMGDTVESAHVKLTEQNEVADLLLKKDGGLFIGLNPNVLGDVSIVFERNSFIAQVSSNPTLAVQSMTPIQSQYADYLSSVCAMPDGHYAIETMIQSLGGDHYRLEVIKTDENGNF